MNIKWNVVVSVPSTLIDMGTLISADCIDDDVVDFKDLGQVLAAYYSFPGHPDWIASADLNLNDSVNFADLGAVLGHYYMVSPIEVP